jgi:hypothetical protein
VDEPPRKPLAKVIEHPSVTIARLQHRRDMLADVLLLLLEAIGADVRAGRIETRGSGDESEVLRAVKRARTVLENLGYEVKR